MNGRLRAASQRSTTSAGRVGMGLVSTARRYRSAARLPEGQLQIGFPSMLIARALRIEAGHRLLIEGASFTIAAGDKVGLVGRNGAGKTTLLRTLAGESLPADGKIGRSGAVGYLSQESPLPPPRKARRS